MRGGSTFGCLFTLAVLSAVLYTGYKFSLAQWDYEGMKEELTNITRYWATQDPTNTVPFKNEIIIKADKLGITINEEDIGIISDTTMLSVDVYWAVPITFPGGYVYKREFTVTRRIRR